MAQQDRGAKTAARRHGIDVQVRLLQQTAGPQHPLVDDPAHRRHTGLIGELARKCAGRHMNARSKFGHCMGLFDVLDQPVAQFSESIGHHVRNRLRDELTLTTGTLGRHHHAARDPVGDFTAQLATHQMQTGIDARSGPGAGDQITVVHEQHVTIHGRRRVLASQRVGVHPVSGAAPTVQQAGRTGDECARADGQDGRASLRGGPHRVKRLLRIALGERTCRKRNQIRIGQALKSVIGDQRRSDSGPQRHAGFHAAHPEVEVRDTVPSAVDTEHLADDAELEYGHPIEHQRGNRTQHG
ncbi:Uncharacterised protein [Mycobacteroides abscessus subsp. abscessus]|nr:Uncharacterised protein [Mycobacteroides abscessus subsp. abscessus]